RWTSASRPRSERSCGSVHVRSEHYVLPAATRTSGRSATPGWCRPPDLTDVRSPIDATARYRLWNPVPPRRVHAPVRHHARIAPMSILISVLITFVVIILVLYLVNMLPIDGRARQIVRVIVIIIGILSLLKYLSVY